MRVTGGAWVRRRVLGPPRGAALRPTPDVLREQAFAVLAPHLEGAAFLDLFAGTGVNALEALSRGAARAVLVDNDPRSLQLIRANLAQFEAQARVDVVGAEAHAALARLARQGRQFSLCWCDPPFTHWEQGMDALAVARAVGVLRPGALVVLETPPRTAVELEGFDVVRALRGAVLVRLPETSAQRAPGG